MQQLWQAQESDSSALWDVAKAGEVRGWCFHMLTRNYIHCFQFTHMELGIKHPLLIGHKMVTEPFPQSTYTGGHVSGCRNCLLPFYDLRRA